MKALLGPPPTTPSPLLSNDSIHKLKLTTAFLLSHVVDLFVESRASRSEITLGLGCIHRTDQKNGHRPTAWVDGYGVQHTAGFFRGQLDMGRYITAQVLYLHTASTTCMYIHSYIGISIL